MQVGVEEAYSREVEHGVGGGHPWGISGTVALSADLLMDHLEVARSLARAASR